MTKQVQDAVAWPVHEKGGWDLESAPAKPYPNYVADMPAGVIPLLLVNSYDTKRNVVL